MVLMVQSNTTEKKLGRLSNRMNEIDFNYLKKHGWDERYIQGYLDCKNWLKKEIFNILEPHQPTDSKES